TKILEAASLDSRLVPKSRFDTAIWTLKSLPEGSAQAPLTREQYDQLAAELMAHEPLASPETVRTEYERDRKLAEIEIAEAEAAFALSTI
ncbi:MAG: hypothetical protein ACRD1B_10805, partial [Thermoanaerobaculia bacterium]